MTTTTYPPFSVRLTVTELAALARLDDLHVPQFLPPPDEGGAARERVEEAVDSLVARGLLELEGDDCSVPAPLRDVLRLVCAGDWGVDGIATTDDTLVSYLRLCGASASDEGVLLATLPGHVVLSYRGDARAVVEEAIVAAFGRWMGAPSSDSLPAAFTDIVERDGWAERRTYSLVARDESVPSLTALRLGDDLFVLEGTAEEASARPLVAGDVEAWIGRAMADR